MSGPAHEPKSWLRSRPTLVVVAFLLVAGFFLLTEHRAHVFGVLPYVLLLACPLMHFFHGGHRHGHGDRNPPRPPANGSAR